jgi:hypothetical protein
MNREKDKEFAAGITRDGWALLEASPPGTRLHEIYQRYLPHRSAGTH